MNAKQLVEFMLRDTGENVPDSPDSGLPPVEKLFVIFRDVNQDLASEPPGDSPPVSFDDVEYYASQIMFLWETNETIAQLAAEELRDFAKAQNYVLPKRRIPDED